jgi:hypothetical protein
MKAINYLINVNSLDAYARLSTLVESTMDDTLHNGLEVGHQVLYINKGESKLLKHFRHISISTYHHCVLSGLQIQNCCKLYRI